MARPSKYTQALIEEICSRLSEGEPLAQICRDSKMPSDRTIRDWKESRADVSAAIAHAREIGFDVIAAECLSIADDGANDPQRDKLRVDTRLKLLAKWDPKRYGEKVVNEHTGSDGGAIQVQQIIRKIVE